MSPSHFLRHWQVCIKGLLLLFQNFIHHLGQIPQGRWDTANFLKTLWTGYI